MPTDTKAESTTAMPPTSEVVAAADLINDSIGRFLGGLHTAKRKIGFYESDPAALNLFTLIIRHTEAVCELARRDLVLLPSALVLARTALETAARMLWILAPAEILAREARYLAHLASEEDYLERTANLLASLGEDAAPYKTNAKRVHDFRTGVEAKLPAHIDRVQSVPKVRSIFAELGEPRAYAIYIHLCQFIHGTHAATTIYTEGLGGARKRGEFITPASWVLPLRCVWWALASGGRRFLHTCEGDPDAFVNKDLEDRVEAALCAITANSAPDKGK